MKKFAIFKSKVGEYFRLYADTMESLAGSGFEDIITEEQLPVVLDGSGGYSTFDPKEPTFVEIIETEKDVPLSLERMYPVNSPDFRLGWVAPNGDTYACNYYSHDKCAAMIVEKYYPLSRFPESTLFRKGWVQIIDSWDGVQRKHGQYVHAEYGKITKKQADKLYDLGLYNNSEVRELIKNCEGLW